MPFPFLFLSPVFLPTLPTCFLQAVSGIHALTFPVDIGPGQGDGVCVGVRGLRGAVRRQRLLSEIQGTAELP